MAYSPRTSLYMTLGALAFLPIQSAHATCHANGRNASGKKCKFTLSAGAALGIAIGIIAFLITLAAAVRFRKRRQANLALRNIQTQRESCREDVAPAYETNYAANYSPSYIHSQTSPTTQSYHSLPGSPPLRDKPLGDQAQRNMTQDHTNAPQFPPPTYAV